MIPNISGKKLLFLIVPAVALFILLFELQWVLQLIVPEKTITHWVAQSLGDTLHVETHVEEVRFGVLPAPSIKIVGLQLMDRTTGAEWVWADALEIRLRFLPLLRGRALPHKLLLKHPHFRLERKKDGTWHFLGYPPSRHDERQQVPSSFPLDMRIDSFLVRNASVEIMDQLRPAYRHHLIIQQMDASFRGLSGPAPIPFEIQGEFPDHRFGTNTFSVKGTVTRQSNKIDLKGIGVEADFSLHQMPTQVFGPWLKESLGIDLREGDINAKGHCSFSPDGPLRLAGDVALDNYKLLAPTYASTPIAGRRVSLAVQLEEEERLLDAKNITLSVDGLTCWGHGFLSFKHNKKVGYGIFLHSSGLSLEALKEYLPDKRLPAPLVRTLRDGHSTGTLDIPLLEITGNLPPSSEGAIPRRQATGILKIVFHDFGLTTEEGLLPLSNVNGLLTLDHQTLQAYGLRGTYGRSVFRSLQGHISLQEPGTVDVDLDGRLNLGEIQRLLLRLPQSFQKRIPATSMPRAAGYADLRVTLSSTGQKKLPPQVSGTVDLAHAGFAFSNFPLILSNLEGRLTFDRNRLHLLKVEGKIDRLPATIQGEIGDLFGKAPLLNLKITANPTGKELNRTFPVMKDFLQLTEEPADLSLHMQGTVQKLSFEGRCDLTQPSLVIPHRLEKPKGVPSFLQFSGRTAKGQGITIEKGTLGMGDTRLSFSGDFQDEEGPLITFSVESPHLSLPALEGIVPSVSPSPPDAFLRAKMGGSFRPGRAGTLLLDGNVALHRTSFIVKGSPRPLRNISGTFLFSGKTVKAKGIHCEWGDVPFSFDMNLPDRNLPLPEFRVRAPFLDVFKLFEVFAKERPEETDKGDDFLKNMNVKADLSLDKVSVHPLDLSNLHASLLLKNGELSISSLRSNGLEGSVKGKGKVNLLSKPYPLFEGEAHLSGVSAEKYLQLLKHNRTFYTGEISGFIRVSGQLYSDLTQTGREMTGSAHLRIKSTRERNYLFALVKEIINRMEIMIGKKDEHFLIVEHDEMGGDFTISNGKFHSTNFYINQYHKFDVSGLTLDKLTAAIPIRIKYDVKAAGSYDFLDSYIDCYVGAEPFSIATKLVKKVPLAGKVLTGKDESLYTIYFRYKGSLAYPDRGTEKAAKFRRINYEDLPQKFRKVLNPH